MIVPISEASRDYAIAVKQLLRSNGHHAKVDETDRKMQKKVREAQLEQWNYILVGVGEGLALFPTLFFTHQNFHASHVIFTRQNTFN